MSVDFSLLNDSELCKLIDCQGAFMEMEYRYLWLVRQNLTKLLPVNNCDKDDFIQEGLLALYYAAKSFNVSKGATFKTYASVCIYNRMCNLLKLNIRQTNYLANLNLINGAEYTASSPEDELELREDFKAVLNRIHISLSEFEKKILAIYLSGSTRAEIPEKYGISIKAYDNAVQRFRNKLKSHGF